MATKFDYQAAKQAGYTDDEIEPFLHEINPSFDLNGAKQAGYSAEEINQFLSTYKPPAAPDTRSLPQKVLEKGTRLATQGLLGGIQRATAGYDIPAIIGRKVGIANAPQQFRQNIFEDIERLQEQKAAGQWDESDQSQYDTLVDLIKNPDKMQEYIPKEETIPHFDVGGLIETGARKAGVDLTPQGADELALRWIGFIKDPSKASNLLKNGLNPKNIKEVVKALAPTGKETLRGAGAGAALQYAAEAELGPIGTMVAAIIGDLAPTLALKSGAAAFNFAKNPRAGIQSIKEGGKKMAAKGIALFTPRDKKALQQAIVNDFREAGVQANLGTISGNNILQWVESTLAQSALTGAPLQELKRSLTKNIVNEYKKLAGELGETVYQSKYEAGEALKSGLREARDYDLGIARDLYNSAKERAGSSQVPTVNVGSLIKEIEESLSPGSFKSNEQRAVVDILNKIKKDVLTPSGESRSAEVKALINDKIALNDAINYEVQGGAKQLLKSLVKEIDNAILKHGKADPKFAQEWNAANKNFSKHANLFRGKTIDQALKTQDPSAIFNKMSTPHGIDQIRKALSVTPEGRALFKELSSYKLEELIGKNMINSTTEQLNFGTFSKLLEKGQNREIVRSLLGNEGLKKLESLQKASGRLANTTQKFLNTSRSGIQLSDTAAVTEALVSVGSALSGNPWPLLTTIGTVVGAKNAATLIADPEFLKLVEEAMFESARPSSRAFQAAGDRLAKRIKESDVQAKGAIQAQNNKE